MGAASLLLAACTTTEQQAPQQPAYNGPIVEISGVEPRYEPINPATSQDYSVNGKRYKIIKDPSNYSETGLAGWYSDNANGTRTATGETFNSEALTAAHPTLPLLCYVRVTNLTNGRQLVVRVNDRGPYTPGRIIALSRAARDRLNLSNNTRVRIDYIKAAPDGSLSGPGTIGTVVAKQSYALPAPPDIGGGTVAPAAQPQAIQPVDNSGLPGTPTPLHPGVSEGIKPEAPAASSPVAAPTAASSTVPTAAAGTYLYGTGRHVKRCRTRQSVD